MKKTITEETRAVCTLCGGRGCQGSGQVLVPLMRTYRVVGNGVIVRVQWRSTWWPFWIFARAWRARRRVIMEWDTTKEAATYVERQQQAERRVAGPWSIA